MSAGFWVIICFNSPVRAILHNYSFAVKMPAGLKWIPRGTGDAGRNGIKYVK
jgi:hypothetical protein